MAGPDGHIRPCRQHRGVPEAEIRAAIQANWATNASQESKRLLTELTTGWYAVQARHLLTDIAPAFSDPPDPATYSERARYFPAGHAAEVARYIDQAHRTWSLHLRYAAKLGQIPGAPPRWIGTFTQLLPALHAFEARHPRPAETAKAPRRSKGHSEAPIPPRMFLVSQGAAARWVTATSPETAAATARAEGLMRAGPWVIGRELRREQTHLAPEFPVVAIMATNLGEIAVCSSAPRPAAPSLPVDAMQGSRYSRYRSKPFGGPLATLHPTRREVLERKAAQEISANVEALALGRTF